MEQAIIREEVISVFRSVFKNAGPITEKTSAADIPEWDSMNHMILISSLEKKFNIKFDLFRLIELQNPGDFTAYILNELNNGNQGS